MVYSILNVICASKSDQPCTKNNLRAGCVSQIDRFSDCLVLRSLIGLSYICSLCAKSFRVARRFLWHGECQTIYPLHECDQWHAKNRPWLTPRNRQITNHACSSKEFPRPNMLAVTAVSGEPSGYSFGTRSGLNPTLIRCRRTYVIRFRPSTWECFPKKLCLTTASLMYFSA